MAARPVLALASLVLVAGGIILQFFIILSGTTPHTPISSVYFLQASTSGIPNARNPARWTYFALCGEENGKNANCGSPVPAFPFAPTRNTNFGTETGVPTEFVGTRYFYFLSRFAWVFYLIALFFAVCAFFTGILALCTRLGAYLSALNTMVALFFQTLAASLMTAWTVKARNDWRRNGHDATLGTYAYAFTWTSFACFLLATVTFCLGGAAGKDRTTNSSGGMFRSKSKRSTKSRGSFVDSESPRRVKDEYS